jgi:hypothetical protein
MNQRVKVLFSDARGLAPEDREELAELLLSTLDNDHSVAWGAEADKRWNDHLEAGDVVVDAFAALDDAAARVAARRSK